MIRVQQIENANIGCREGADEAALAGFICLTTHADDESVDMSQEIICTLSYTQKRANILPNNFKPAFAQAQAAFLYF